MNNLLITTIGKYNHLAEWMKGERNFDVALVNYDRSEHDYELIRQTVYYDTFETFKYPGIWDMFNDEPRLLRYDYFWMPDEDILLSTEEINKLFDRARELNLDLCQPSVSADSGSFPSWKQFIQRSGVDVVYNNFVEIMCPMFRKEALKICLETFLKSRSGWGLDIAWTKLLEDSFEDEIAIINSIVVKHTRPIGGGELYPKLKLRKEQPSSERKRVMAEYGLKEISYKEYRRI